MPSWIAQHHAVLTQIAATSAVARRAVQNLPTSTSEVVLAVAVELLLIVVATALFTRRIGRGFRLYLYSALLGIFSFHALTHLGQAIVLRGYTPGVISAVLVIPPIAVYLYSRLIRPDLLTWRTAILTAIAGALLFLPIVELAHLAGHALA
jgi:hypothetical protein